MIARFLGWQSKVAALPDGSRVNAVIPPPALDGPGLSIRRVGGHPVQIYDLVRNQSLSSEMAEFLRLVTRRAEYRASAWSSDLALMTGELTAGFALADALRNLPIAPPIDDVKSLVGVLVQSEQMGTRLAPALRACAEQFAVRRRLRAEERAQRAAVKMLVPLVVFILPAMLMVVLGPAILQILRVVTE